MGLHRLLDAAAQRSFLFLDSTPLLVIAFRPTPLSCHTSGRCRAPNRQ